MGFNTSVLYNMPPHIPHICVCALCVLCSTRVFHFFFVAFCWFFFKHEISSKSIGTRVSAEFLYRKFGRSLEKRKFIKFLINKMEFDVMWRGHMRYMYMFEFVFCFMIFLIKFMKKTL